MIVKIKVDQNDPAQVEALSIFLRSFSDKGAKSEPTLHDYQKAVIGQLFEPTKTEPAAKPKQAKAATPQPEPAAAPEPEPVKAEPLRIEDVRAAVAVKAPKHLAALRAELARLGAASVTNLNAAHYAEFLDFVNALPA